jgi:hypothetical protein
MSTRRTQRTVEDLACAETREDWRPVPVHYVEAES